MFRKGVRGGNMDFVGRCRISSHDVAHMYTANIGRESVEHTNLNRHIVPRTEHTQRGCPSSTTMPSAQLHASLNIKEVKLASRAARAAHKLEASTSSSLPNTVEFNTSKPDGL